MVRYIEADDAINELKREFPNDFGKIIRCISRTQTADVPDRKVGKWEPLDRTRGCSIYYCTSCGQSEYVRKVFKLDETDAITEMGKVVWKYCPNCGARMVNK